MKRALLALVLVLGACATRTEIVVVMQSDVAIPADADELFVRVTRAADPPSAPALFERSYLLPGEATLPASLSLTGAEDAPRVSIVVQLRKDGVVRVERKATVPFAPARSLLLRLSLEAVCLGVVCSDPGTTCVSGACVPALVDPLLLPPVGEDPFSPGPDAPSPVDAAIPTDGAISMDLASFPDGSTACPTILSTPPVPVSCVLYTFAARQLPAGFLAIVPPDVTFDFACGTYNIHMPMSAQAHVLSAEVDSQYRLQLVPSAVTNAIISAGYRTRGTQPGAWAGLQFHIGSSVAALQGGRNPTDPSSDRFELFAGGWNGSPVSSRGMFFPSPSKVGEHKLELARQAVNNPAGSQYSVTLDDVPQNVVSVDGDTGLRIPSFIVGNDRDAIDVEIGWIMVCPQ